MTDHKRVYLKWVDSCALHTDEKWTNREEFDSTKGEAICETLGWIIDENEHSYYVAGHLSPEEYGSIMQIPRVAVKELNYLETDDRDDSDSPGERGLGSHPLLGLG